MSFEYTIYPEENLIRMKCSGDFTIPELMEHTLRVNQDPKFQPGMNTLGDYLDAHWVGEVQEMSDYLEHTEMLEKVRGKCRWAILLRTDGGRKLIEMYNLMVRERGIQIETRAFTSEQEALAWLSE